MPFRHKRVLAYCGPESTAWEAVYADPDEVVFVTHAATLMPKFMHSAKVRFPNVFGGQEPDIEAVMFHQAVRNGCPENKFGTTMLRNQATQRIKGRSRTTAYGDVWFDFGVRDVAVFDAISTKVNLKDPDERDAFCSNVNRWFPGCKAHFHPNPKGMIDLYVFSPRSVPAENVFHAKMHWG